MRDDDPAQLRHRVAAELNRALLRAEKRHGHTLDRAELARRINVSPSSLYAYLNGTTLPGTDVFDAILTALGVTGPQAGRLGTLRDTAETARRVRPPAGRVPRQLPPPVPGFVGRKAELARLDDLLDSGTGPVVIAVEGTAGVGKTTLALAWANRVQDRFPDGQLHADLRGFGPEEPIDPSVALHGLLLGLGVASAAVPVHPPAASALLRTLLADRRVLLVLDNARSAEQVRPLLPGGPGSVAIVTSRNRLDGLVVREGAQRLSVDVLPRYDAHALLARRIGADRLARENRATVELVDLCARLPLALSVASARVAAGPEDAFPRLVAELREAHRRLDALGLQDADVDLRTVFDQSYALLPAPAARLFRLLGCHPGPEFDATACAALLGVPEVPRGQLDALTTAHLVRQHLHGRYVRHDLLRLYARERAEAEPRNERLEATGRLLSHYLDCARQADRALEPWLADRAGGVSAGAPVAPGDHGTAMAWFETELATLQALITQAAATDGLEAYAWRLADALAVYLRRSGRRQQRAAVHATARTAAERTGDRHAWARAGRRLGDALSRLHRFDEALDLLRSVLRTCRAGQDHEGMRETRLSLVRVHAARGDHARALPHARIALALAERTDDLLALADGLTSVAQEEQWLGRPADALAHGRRALSLYTRLGHLDGQASMLLCLGRVDQELGRPAEAAEHFEASLALDRALGDRYREAHALDHLADATEACGHRHRALLLREDALAVLEELHHPDARLVRAKLTGSRRSVQGSVQDSDQHTP